MGTIITGAASGIGLATAQLLHSKGKTVCLWDIDAEGIKTTATLLNADYCVVDVTDYEQVKHAMTMSIDKMGQLDVVIHCAGIAHVGLFAIQAIEALQQMIDVNFTGTIHIAHASIPYLKETQGSLVLVASSSSFYGPPDFAVYGATKSAIVRFAEALRLELEQDKVHVGVISPHFVQTPMLDESKKSAMYEGTAYTSSADEIAQAIEKMIRLRQDVSVPGGMNKVNYFLSWHVPQIAPFIVRMLWRYGQRKRR